MFKRIAALVIAAGITSALLLYIGTTVMGEFTSAFAASLPALVTGRGGQDDNRPHLISTSQAGPTASGLSAAGEDRRKGADKPEDTPAPNPNRTPDDDPSQTPEATSVPTSGVTIAQLLSGSAQFEDGVFTITGIATRVNQHTFLLNDGTGQILVDLEDNLVQVTILDGGMVTVTGEFRRLGGQNGLGLKACVLSDSSGATTVDTCEFNRHGENEPTDDHGGGLNPTSGADDHGGQNSGSGSSGSNSGSSSSGSGSSGSGSGGSGSGGSGSSSGSGRHGGDDNPKP